ncbi:dipeptidase [Spirosoma linguale]|uniref:Dipeptidase n=1 Tax=Spirosoma linguale (strain ATCC 33905 / DSM 74 / LMG 10896 / Claus 1) TaxID=504472 RepID=D2QQF1_SPILD|nr:peptidase U34 dipeptidase [Spirosoma linguale DSM 74]
MIITCGATQDGSMLVTHSDDNELSDQRFIFVPAQDHTPGSMRGIVAGINDGYPRLVSKDRGPGYDTQGWPVTPIIGLIPQVDHTYAYFDGSYGIMNEHNLMFGECTNGAKYMPPNPVTKEEAEKTGKHSRLFYSAELSRVALERCRLAREAVNLMGLLIDEYGYFSTGETLLVADEKEAWVFEMCALPDEEYHSAWIAQRVPDGTVFVAANEFRIREIKPGSDDQIFSSRLIPGLTKLGWTPKEGPIDWLVAISQGEYNHPYYSLRRVWRVFDRVNPDLGLSPWVENGYTMEYPFSIKPKNKLQTKDVFSLYRDHYEGTQFDMTKGIAAGPYGDPTRIYGNYDGSSYDISNHKLYGAWERPISVYYQGYTYVLQTQPNAHDLTKGVCWFGPDISYTTCFVPFPAKVERLPLSYQIGDPQKFSRAAAWWSFDFVANWARLNFQRIYRVDIQPLQMSLEVSQANILDEWERKAHDGCSRHELTALCEANASEVINAWWELADMLVAKYSDGYINQKPSRPQNEGAVSIGYSSDWLKLTNYQTGPISYDMDI